MTNFRTIVSSLLLLILAAGCMPAATQPNEIEQATLDTSASGTDELIDDNSSSAATSTPPATPTLAPTTEPTATPVAVSSVRISAVGGNLYIRRGPGTRYNRIGLLAKGMSAEVIAKDVLSKWVQIRIPDSEFTGWVSLLTPYTQVEGDLSTLDSFTFKEWPEPAYIKNCTEHDLWVGPNDLYLYSLWTNSQYLNEVQVDPGVYEIYDLFVPGEPKIETVDVQEGETAYITVNGLGVKHNCP